MSESHGVLVVEDDVETRARFVRAIESDARLHLHGAVENCLEARSVLAQSQGPEVLLVDLGLPDGSGIELIRETRELHPRTLVLVITVFAEQSHVVASVRAGASGYLLKDGATTELASSIVELLAGGSPLSAAVARHVLRLVQGTQPPAMDDTQSAHVRTLLTKRELEVLEVLARGFKSGEIGGLLGISTHTVIAHTRSIHRKLQVGTRAEAIFEAVNLGLIRLQ